MIAGSWLKAHASSMHHACIRNTSSTVSTYYKSIWASRYVLSLEGWWKGFLVFQREGVISDFLSPPTALKSMHRKCFKFIAWRQVRRHVSTFWDWSRFSHEWDWDDSASLLEAFQVHSVYAHANEFSTSLPMFFPKWLALVRWLRSFCHPTVLSKVLGRVSCPSPPDHR